MSYRIPRRWRLLLAYTNLSLPLLSAAAAADDTTFASQIGVLVEYYEVDHAALAPLLRSYQAAPDASDLLENLQQMEGAGEAQMVESSYLVAIVDQAAKINSAREHIYPTEYDPAEIPGVMTGPIDPALDFTTSNGATAFDIRELGTSVELEPKLEPSGTLVRLNIAPKRVVLVGETNYGFDEARSRKPLFESLTIHSNVAVADERSLLLDMHSLETARAGRVASEAEQQAVSQRRVLVFVTAKVKRLDH